MRPRAADRHGSVEPWMTRHPEAVDEACPVSDALARMRAAGVRHLLVMESGRLCGVLSTRDLGRLVLAAPGSASLHGPVRSIMTEDPVTVAPDTPVHEAARLLLDGKIGALAVRDGERIVGIFTTQDALEALLSIAERA